MAGGPPARTPAGSGPVLCAADRRRCASPAPVPGKAPRAASSTGRSSHPSPALWSDGKRSPPWSRPTASSSRQTLPGQAWISPRASGVTVTADRDAEHDKGECPHPVRHGQRQAQTGPPRQPRAWSRSATEPAPPPEPATSQPAPPSAKVSTTLPRTVAHRDQGVCPGGEPGRPAPAFGRRGHRRSYPHDEQHHRRLMIRDRI